MFTAHSLTVAIPINHCPGPWNDYQFMLHFPCVLESSSSAFCGEISAFGVSYSNVFMLIPQSLNDEGTCIFVV